jgi:hypothetical protein
VRHQQRADLIQHLGIAEVYAQPVTIRWSRIHAQLGEVPGDPSFAMIKAAVAAKLAEASDLDWKETLPDKAEASLQEFAKDVAAMANTIGGLIVFGVKETRGTGRAEVITSVDVSENVQRRLRALAHSRIRPLVAGLKMLPLMSADGKEAVLVLSVPRSPDAPHTIARDGGEGRDGWLGVPFRSGPETHWMRERELERAYRDRFSRQVAEQEHLASLMLEVGERLGQEAAPWIVGVARPRTPLAGIVAPPSMEDIRRLLTEVVPLRSVEILPKSGIRIESVSELGIAAHNPRVGLRRWVVQTQAPIGSEGLANFVHVQLHHDGSVALAVAMDVVNAETLDGFTRVPQSVVESFAADFIALVEAYARELGAQTPMSFRVDLAHTEASKPLVLIDFRRFGENVVPPAKRIPGSFSLSALRPVEGEIPLTGDLETLRAVAREMAADVINQFGVAALRMLG